MGGLWYYRVLKEMAHGKLLRPVACARREVRRICSARQYHWLPFVRNFKALPAGYARAHLGPDAPGDELAACAAYLDHVSGRSALDSGRSDGLSRGPPQLPVSLLVAPPVRRGLATRSA